MKISSAIYICIWLLCLSCNHKSQKEHLTGKWICIRLDKSLSAKGSFEEFKRTRITGTIFKFNNTDKLDVLQDNDTSSHYYTLSADKKFLMYELLGSAASLHKIILLNKDSLKLSMNFNDTMVFAKIK